MAVQVAPGMLLQSALAMRRLRLGTGTLLALAVVVGCVLRLHFWWAGRSFWLDEVSLALNITGRSFAELWQPLDHDQGAPVGFLMLVKVTHVLFGSSEQALRLLPLVAGLGSMLLFPTVARRWLPPAGALFAVALFAVTPKLVYYSSELKQYSLDVFVAVLLLSLVPNGKRLLMFGTLAVWFSHPALFVLAGVGVVLLIDALRRRDHQETRRLLLMGGCWLLSFAVCWWFCLRELSKNAYLMTYWTESFAPAPPRNFEQLGWYARAVTRLFEGPAGMMVADVSLAVPAALLFTLGWFWLWKAKPQAAWILIAPLIVTLVASALQRYPFGGRLLLFAVPLLVLGLAAGFMAMLWSSRGPARVLGLAVGALVIVAPLGTSLQNLARPCIVEDHRAAVQYITARWQPGDGVLLSGKAAEPWRYYSRSMPVLGQVQRGDWANIHGVVTQLQGHERLWVFVAHEKDDDHKALRWQLDQVGTMTQQFTGPGVAAYLYDTCSSQPTRPAGAIASFQSGEPPA